MSFGSVGSKGGVLGKRPGGTISMKLKPQSEPEAKKLKAEATVPSKPSSKPSSKLVAQAFGSDSEEEEEMPPEAKLRMRNIGKNTPTSAGPNSFNKSQRGFSDPKASQTWRQTD